VCGRENQREREERERGRKKQEREERSREVMAGVPEASLEGRLQGVRGFKAREASRRARGEGGFKAPQIYILSIKMGIDGLLDALLCLMRVSPTI